MAIRPRSSIGAFSLATIRIRALRGFWVIPFAPASRLKTPRSPFVLFRVFRGQQIPFAREPSSLKFRILN